MGNLHRRDDNSYRAFDGRLPALFAPGKVLEGSVIGFALLLAILADSGSSQRTATLKIFKLSAPTLAWSMIGYGFAASVLPVWLLLAPRDYLSTFLKLGTIFSLALGVVVVRPTCRCRR